MEIIVYVLIIISAHLKLNVILMFKFIYFWALSQPIFDHLKLSNSFVSMHTALYFF